MGKKLREKIKKFLREAKKKIKKIIRKKIKKIIGNAKRTRPLSPFEKAHHPGVRMRITLICIGI